MCISLQYIGQYMHILVYSYTSFLFTVLSDSTAKNVYENGLCEGSECTELGLFGV